MTLPTLAPPAEKATVTKKETMTKEENKTVMGLLNNVAAIHEDIRKMARKMDIEKPTIDMSKLKLTTLVPPAEDAAKES